jgi:hypothetical protein
LMAARFAEQRSLALAEVTEALARGALVAHGAGSGTGRRSCTALTGPKE